MAAMFVLACPVSLRAADELGEEDLVETSPTSGPHEPVSIAEELARAVDLLDREIAVKRQALHEAQTDRERQLIHDHLNVLRQEQQSLSRLLSLLIGPQFDARQAAREQQQDLQYERAQKQLERDERFSNP